MKELIGFALVIISAFPMGIAEGRIINLQENYTIPKVVPVILLYAIGFAIYLAGFMQIPTKIGFVVGVWEISAVTISVIYAILQQSIKWDREYTFWFAVLLATTYILGVAADKIFAKAGIQ
jgi:hypothetical protein